MKVKPLLGVKGHSGFNLPKRPPCPGRGAHAALPDHGSSPRVPSRPGAAKSRAAASAEIRDTPAETTWLSGPNAVS